MQKINMTRNAARELRDAITIALEGDNGLVIKEIVLKAGDPSGRDEEPTNEVEFDVVYETSVLKGDEEV